VRQRVNYRDCVPGCNAECMPTCMEVSKDVKACIPECQEFCDRDCYKEATGEDLSPYQQKRETRQRKVDNMPGDRGRDSFSYRKTTAVPPEASIPADCDSGCFKGCETKCPGKDDKDKACLKDCRVECQALCRPQDPGMGGSDGDRLLAEAEKPDARPSSDAGSTSSLLSQGFYIALGVLGAGALAFLWWTHCRGGRPAAGLVRYTNKL